MKTLLIATSALALAAPAFAQTTGTPGSAPQSQTAPTSADPMAKSQSDTSQAASSQTAPAETATPPAAAETPSDPKAIIAAEFPTYDKDGSGALDVTEFSSWMVALKEKSGAAPMKASEKTAWLKGAFATADADKNKAVSQTELTTYLTAGA